MKESREYLSKILDAESIEDLMGVGPASDILNKLNANFHPFVLTVDSYKDLLEAVKAVRRSWPKENKGPFVSRQAEIVFYLTKTDGKLRKKFLEITDEHYRDRKLAKKWFKSLAQIIHSDKIGEDPIPFQTLSKIYEEMTHEDDGDE
ncbi:hypothetical protein [Pseudomonas koreensis]|uniref:hypothetical protein n=1 Tax=Pseudomonas koreensis TaxID=198620 RepID=UPI003208E60C